MIKKKILFYIVSPIHLKNIEILSQYNTHIEILVIYEPNIKWFDEDFIMKYNFKFYKFKKNKLSNDLWSQKISAVFLFSAQARISPLNLINEAKIRNIPVIGIEENYQMMLQNQEMFNYSLPLDFLFICSNYEKEKIVKLGFNKDILKTVGWPFHSNINLFNKKKLNKKYILLALTAADFINPHSIENNINRIKMFKDICNSVINENYEILIKTHPGENENNIKKIISSLRLKATVAKREKDIQELINKSEFVINSGFSQVIIEAIFSDIPVIIYSLGDNSSFFHNNLNKLIVKNSYELERLLKKDKNYFKKEIEIFKSKFLQINPQESIILLNNEINKILSTNYVSTNKEILINLIIWNIYFKNYSYANKLFSIIDNFDNSEIVVNSISRILNDSFTLDDLKILLNFSNNIFCKNAIYSIIVDYIIKNKKFIEKNDYNILKYFPTKINILSYSKNIFRLYIYLYSQKDLNLFTDFHIKLEQHNYFHLINKDYYKSLFYKLINLSFFKKIILFRKLIYKIVENIYYTNK